MKKHSTCAKWLRRISGRTETKISLLFYSQNGEI
nr:MAG TPA: hypothetical protein [Bacteriophage sp.]